MRLSTASVVAALTLLVGIIFAKPYLWIPATVLGAAIVYLVAGPWAKSEKVGSSEGLSTTLKLAVNVVGLYATIGQVACAGLLLWWALR